MPTFECRWRHDIQEKHYKYAANDFKVYENRREGVVARNHDLCTCTMRVDHHDELGMVLSRLSSATHLHDLDAMDKYKINNALRSRVDNLIWQGIAPCRINVGLHGVGMYYDGPEQLYEAGGRWINTKTITGWARQYQDLASALGPLRNTARAFLRDESIAGGELESRINKDMEKMGETQYEEDQPRGTGSIVQQALQSL